MDFRYTAIVLKKKEIGETDRLYTFLTKEGGKIRAKAVGVRKPHAKLAASLETLMCSDVTVVRGKGIGKVAGAVVEEPFLRLRSDLDILSLALETAETIDAIIGLEEPDERIFSLFFEYLSVLDGLASEGDSVGAMLVTEGFFVKLFSELGYHIETSVCAVSGDRLRSGERCFFNFAAGGVVRGTHADEYSVALGENAIKLLRVFSANRLSSLRKVRVEAGDIGEVSRVRKLFLRHILR